MEKLRTYESLVDELEELKLQLLEANETVEAIRSGQVDALVVKTGDDHQLYTLKSADQTYRVFIEKMKEGAVNLNKDGIILYSNSQFASMVDLPLSRIIGLQFSDFVPDKFQEEYERLIEQGWRSDSKGEISLKNKQNHLVPFLLTCTSLELDEGKALSIILTDLTGQKETEKQLKQQNKQLEEARLAVTKINERLEEIVKERTNELFLSREHFKFLADNIPVIVWTTEADGARNYLNRQWHEYTGLDLEHSLGAGWQAALHPDDLVPTNEAWSEAIKEQKTFEFEYRLKRASDGIYRWHLAKGEPFKDESGRIIAWFGTSTDIEDQRREIERKDEFISVASHELKTPLTSLKGYLQLMQEQEHLPDDTKMFITRGNASINKLQHLINDLLDASKIKAGKLEFNKEVIDLAQLANNCIENCRYMYPAFNIKKELDENVMVLGNHERLEQVIMNLVNNAVKYSPVNKKINFLVEKKDDRAIVSIKDFGVGMSQADQKKVFERFYRAGHDKSTPGLGMGLYISAEIVKQHNGSMSVQSKPGKGSVFSFSLPLIETSV
ncbi:MAG TPA: ATP-binding protein [Chitinophagaceae bacterium]|nr:ATP-binding protein [Chitinophagaceae bacterium]